MTGRFDKYAQANIDFSVKVCSSNCHCHRKKNQALFSSEKWKLFGTVALSFVCDKYYSIID